MAPRPIMDPTKARIAAITMAYKDYDLLENWVRYYEKQFGREHLYILSHGGDPEHKKITEGANLIYLPRDETMQKWDRKRWFFLTNFTNGLLRYYNWVICGDVDEIVIVDPEQAESLTDYINRYSALNSPLSLSPLGLETVHNPDLEKEALDGPGTILEKRRLFRLNANYSKPCVIRKDVGFTIGGHANNHQPRYLDPHLYLIHLRYYDFDLTCERLKGRSEMRKTIQGDPKVQSKQPWDNGIASYKKLACQEPHDTTIDFPEFRKKMLEGAQHLHNGKITFFGGGRSKVLYRLPDRFISIF